VNDLTKSEAQKLKRDWMKKLNDRREVAGNSQTLAGFWREHFYDKEKKEAKHELKDKRPSTVRDIRFTVNQIWIPRFGERLLDSLGTAEIQKYLDSLNLSRQGCGHHNQLHQVNRHAQLLRADTESNNGNRQDPARGRLQAGRLLHPQVTAFPPH
jgi:hypothetical protein